MERREFFEQFLKSGKARSIAPAVITYGIGKLDYTKAPEEIKVDSVAACCHLTFVDSEKGQKVLKVDEKLNQKRSGIAKSVQIPIIKKRLNRDNIGDYIKDAFQKSNLPPLLKELGPYIVRQESRGSRTIESGCGAQGLWQFMRGTSKQMGVKERKDPKQSTRGAIKYLTKIYADLGSCEGFQKIEQWYTKHPEGNLSLHEHILPLLTINAYNSGEGHMTNALKHLAERPDELQEYHEKRGGVGGIFEWITKEYASRRRYTTFQKQSPYYLDESSAYVYQIMHRYLLDNKHHQSALLPESKEILVNESSPLKNTIGAISSALLGYLSVKTYQEKPLLERPFERRDIIKGGITGLGVFTLSRLGIIEGSWRSLFATLETEPTALTTNELDKSYRPELEHIKNIYFDRVADKTYDKENKGVLEKDVDYMIHKEYYLMDQHIGDIAAELYVGSLESLITEELSDKEKKKYKHLAITFYKKAITISERQLNGAYKLPPGGKEEVQERISYCTNALGVVEEK